MKLKSCACSPASVGQIEAGDVNAICTRNKTARAFALGDALGDRDLPACCGDWMRNCGRQSSIQKI